MSESAVTLGDVERLCWSLSGWRVEQRDVDALLSAVVAYAGAQVPAQGRRGLQGGAGEAAQPSDGPGEAGTGPESTSGPTVAHSAVQAPGIEGAYVLTLTRVDTPPRKGPHRDTGSEGRTCRKCGARKPLDGFNRDLHSPGGRKTACKDCENKRKREAGARKRAAERAKRGAR